MKRGGPLRRTTRLHAHRRLSPRAPIAPQSAKRRALAPKRRTFVAEVLTARPTCEAKLDGCTGRSTDVHELCRRSQGADLLAADEVLALCRRCHSWVTEHPVEAVERGLAVWGWQYRQNHRT